MTYDELKNIFIVFQVNNFFKFKTNNDNDDDTHSHCRVDIRYKYINPVKKQNITSYNIPLINKPAYL